jgi:hypothetical protein
MFVRASRCPVVFRGRRRRTLWGFRKRRVTKWLFALTAKQ